MLTMERKRTSLFEDIADYAKDGRLTEPSDGKRYEWLKIKGFKAWWGSSRWVADPYFCVF